MPKRLMSLAAPAALVVAIAAGPTAAQPGVGPQLTIAASPDPGQTVAGKTVLTFSATVLQSGHDHRVELGALWSSEWKNPGTGFHSVSLPFTAKYTVPSSAKPGSQLCFSLTRRTGPASTLVVAKQCRTVSAPSVTAGTQPAPTVAAGATTGTPHVNAADRPPRTARGRASLPPGPPPDLTVEYKKTPVAKWIVRNIGQGPAPATVLRLSRAGLPNKDIPIAALPAGAIADIVVTPDLDALLINASAKVDPHDQVKESNEANNTWQSAQSR